MVYKGSQRVNGKSILGILTLAAGYNSQITIEAKVRTPKNLSRPWRSSYRTTSRKCQRIVKEIPVAI
jgi:hypothetical protein